MEEPDRTEEHEPGADDSAPEDERAAHAPAEQADGEPVPGEDPGPLGNPAQDEEGLSHQQQDDGD